MIDTDTFEMEISTLFHIFLLHLLLANFLFAYPQTTTPMDNDLIHNPIFTLKEHLREVSPSSLLDEHAKTAGTVISIEQNSSHNTVKIVSFFKKSISKTDKFYTHGYQSQRQILKELPSHS